MAARNFLRVGLQKWINPKYIWSVEVCTAKKPCVKMEYAVPVGRGFSREQNTWTFYSKEEAHAFAQKMFGPLSK